MFFYAYREFVRALGDQDTKVLKKMTEPTLFAKLQENFRSLEEFNARFFSCQEGIKMKMKLLDMQMI